MPKLKPCPFCGGNAEYVKRLVTHDRAKEQSVSVVFIQCQTCLAQSRCETIYLPDESNEPLMMRMALGAFLEYECENRLNQAWNRRHIGRGHWIDDKYGYYQCDQCGCAHDYPEYFKFCPYCGADMRKVNTHGSP